MPFVFTCAWKDLLRLRRDPIGLVAWLVLPLMIIALLGLAFGGGQATPHGRLLVADEDHSMFSRAVPNALKSGALATMLSFEPVKLEDGRAQMDRGEASALLVIDKGFGAAVIHRQPFQLRLFTNPGQRILPGIIRQSLSIATERISYMERLGSMTKLNAALNSPLIRIDTRVTVDANRKKPVNFAALFFPGMLMLSLLGVGHAMAADLWRERESGSLRRLAVTPRRVESFLGGKLLAVFAVDVAIVLCAIAPAAAWLGVPWRGQLTGVAWVCLAGCGLYLLMAVINVYSSNARAAAMMSLFALFLASMVGGTFFPFESMPLWLAAIGRFTPNGWAIVAYKRILDSTFTPSDIAFRAAGLTAGCAILFWMVSRRLRQVVAS